MNRPTCPNHPGRLIDTHPCQVCGYSLPNHKAQHEGRGQNMTLAAVSNPLPDSMVDPDTGEIPGQLQWTLNVPYEEQRRAKDGMTAEQVAFFVRSFQWGDMKEGDSITVKVVKGQHVVTHKEGWK